MSCLSARSYAQVHPAPAHLESLPDPDPRSVSGHGPWQAVPRFCPPRRRPRKLRGLRTRRVPGYGGSTQ
eukprot:5126937-Amphidinium_carterae.1